jgi:hypothetical protein
MLVRCMVDPLGVDQNAVAIEYDRAEREKWGIQTCPDLTLDYSLLRSSSDRGLSTTISLGLQQKRKRQMKH